MKIIAFGDIHMAAEKARHIVDIDKADLVVLNGDLTNCGGRKEVKQVLDTILRYNPHVMAQFGNMDRGEVNDYLESCDINLHAQARMFQGGVCFVGIGGSNQTPFYTPSEFTEKQLDDFGVGAFRQARQFIDLAEPLYRQKIPLIFFSHVPPHNTKIDKIPSGKHVGSLAVRRLIEHYQPDLCVVGHVHEGKGSDYIGNTLVFNPGPLLSGGWVTIELAHSELHVSLS
jgi:Icc-related predicted phosphoesterase